ncbi:MAG TPA: hypothetical protein DCP32_11830 [Anaerolineaceae bacterium]|nr:MAG: hypothetical protein A2X24_09185 [Chloroflexi bacterium GWB2_54_36]HAL17401.1 hypothetical protein [Anaerolineaceae bacterium]HBA90759.1 hypothetical protein [Anaerolineaceae bacterium]
MEPSEQSQRLTRRDLSMLWLLITIAVIVTLTASGPTERTLGENLRLVVLHGAWVWTGKILFAAAALAGLAGLFLPRSFWSNLSLALGRAGLLFWLTYLPMSLIVQMQNWGGIFWDEPRWRVPFTFGVVGLLLQLGLWVINQSRVTDLANLVFGVVLWWQLGAITNILHPDSPIFGSDSTGIQFFFLVLLGLVLFAAAQITRLLYRSLSRSRMPV